MFHQAAFVEVDGPDTFDESRIIAYDKLTNYEAIWFIVNITIYLNFVL